jgi:hypothetical protein
MATPIHPAGRWVVGAFRTSGRNMKIPVVVISLSVAALECIGFAHAASKNSISPARARAIGECMAMQRQYPNESFFGVQLYHYRACMARHGQPE